MRAPLGEILLDERAIDATELEHALSAAKRSGMRLGHTLVGEGVIGYLPLYRALAKQYGLPLLDLLESPPGTTLLSAEDIGFYLQEHILPVSLEDGTLQLAVCDYNERIVALCHQTYGRQVAFALATPHDIHRAVERMFAPHLIRQSTLQLFESDPDYSARKRFSIKARNAAFFALLAAIAAMWQAPVFSLLLIMGACHVLYGFTMLFKLAIYVSGAFRQEEAPRWQIPQDAELPVYTILIPMYKEVESLPGMLAAMQAMDYPASKLDIKLVLEEDDTETYRAACALKPRYQFEIIRVPPSEPRTKPKACNYALHFARGEYLTVYDADDRPDPHQLKKVLSTFRASSPNTACLQARLNYYNAHDNWLTRLFSLEYAMLFNVLLPGLFRLEIPIMLGGTSNHFALSRLRELGEWDPFNVTEDADLGTRLASRGFRSAMVDSDTLEEAPNDLRAWLAQRTRWIKGYMQTWLVYMRHPVRLWRALGGRGFLGFQCFVALSSFSYLTAPLSWGLMIIWLSGYALPVWLQWLTLGNLLANLFIHVGTALHVASFYRHHGLKMALGAATYPFYLVLHSIASYVALWQLIVKPYVWNKTTHGKAKTNIDFQLTRPMAAG